jgi:leucokinin receptor
MTLINVTSMIACNASPPGSIYMDSSPPIPPPYLQATAVIVYTLLSVLTVGGNALVCFIVFHFMGVITVTNLFIANLAVTDLFIGLFCIPIVLVSDYLLSDWPLGTFMCKFTSFAQSVFVVCTVYTLIAMSVDRYIAIIHPLKPKLTRKKCRILIGLLWTFSILFSSPIFIDMNIRHTCYHRDLDNQTEYFQTKCETTGLPPSLQTAYNVATIIIIYLIPLCVLTIIYIRLGWRLHQTRAPGEAHSERDAKIKKSKQKVIKMCFVVVIMFGVCWFPLQLYTNILYSYLDQIFRQEYVPHIYFTFHLMAMSNSCVNPAIYGVMSSKFRLGYLHYWHCLITCCGLSNNRFRNKEDRMENNSIATTFQLKNKTHELKVKKFDMDCDQASNTSIPCSMPLISSQRVSSND